MRIDASTTKVTLSAMTAEEIESLVNELDDGRVNRDAEMYEDIIEVVEQVVTTTIDEIAEYELDLFKRKQLVEYASTLSPDDQLRLLDTLKVLIGPSHSIAAVEASMREIIFMAQKSVLLQQKKHAADQHLQNYHRLSQQIQRFLSGSFSDDLVNSLRIDGIQKHVHTLEEQLTILSTGIYSMASRIGLDKYVEPENMPINIERLLKVLLIVGHSAKGWAVSSENAKTNAIKTKEKTERLEKSLKDANQQIAELKNELDRIRKQEQFRLQHTTDFFYIMNSNAYLATEDEVDEFGDVILSPGNVYFTPNIEEALSITNLEEARTVFGLVKRWHKRFPDFTRMMRHYNVYLPSLYIARSTTTRVEG